MPSRANLLSSGFLATLIAGAFAVAASADPITYNGLVPSADNSVTTVQVGTAAPSPCPVGSGNCLEGGVALPIDAVSITLDQGTSQVLDLNIFASGPATLLLGGYNGYEKIVFSDVEFQSTGPAAIGAGGAVSINGVVTAAKLEIFLTGGLGGVPDIVVTDYTTAGSPFNLTSGTVTVQSTGEVAVGLQGINLGMFPDLGPDGQPTGTYSLVKADLGFVATVPEPGAALLYGVGLLIAASTVRRRAAAVAR